MAGFAGPEDVPKAAASTTISRWPGLIGEGDGVPSEAMLCIERLDESGVPWRASWNFRRTEVFSCRHAVRFRDRLGSGGNGGIPLWAELYSLLGFVVEPTRGIKIPFVAHSRANTEFCDAQIVAAVGLTDGSGRIQRLMDDGKENILQEQPCYGRVNPFSVDLVFQRTFDDHIELPDIVQLFDESLFLDGGIPDTVMSNLWDRRLGFEIQPKALVEAVTRLSPRSQIAKIAEPSPIWLGLKGNPAKDYWRAFPPPAGPKIGILTGNAPEAGLQLWTDILSVLRGHYEHLPDVLMPETHIHSLPQMGLSMDLVDREEDVWEAMRYAITGLLELGCKIITLACNTTIYFEPRIVALAATHGARFVSIAEACVPAIRGALKGFNGCESVGLIGIGPVIDMTGPYSGYKRHLDAENITVTPCNGADLAFKAKSEGANDVLVTNFRHLVNDRLNNERVIVLALTEVSMLYRRHIAKAKRGHKGERTFIDPLLELAKYLSWIYVTEGYRGCAACQIPADFPIEDMLAWMSAEGEVSSVTGPVGS